MSRNPNLKNDYFGGNYRIHTANEIKALIIEGLETGDWGDCEPPDSSESGWHDSAKYSAASGDVFFVEGLAHYDAAQMASVYRITNKTSGLNLGEYRGLDDTDALEAMFKSAGYEDLEDAERRVPDFDADDFEIREV